MNTWYELDSATRKALLRGEPADDPEIDRIARAHAEKMLQRSSIRSFLIVLPCVLVLSVLLGLLSYEAGLPKSALAPVVIVTGIGWTVFEARRKLALIRLLNISRGTVQQPVLPGATERLEIRLSAWGFLRTMAGYPVLVLALFAVGVVLSNPWVLGTAVIFGVPVVGYLSYMLLAWSLPGHPILVLDSEGIHTPKSKTRVNWESVREIRVVPLRAKARDTRKVIAFVLHDNQIYLRQLPRWQALLANTNTKTYLSPVISMDGMADKSVEEIAAAAAALSGLSVSAVSR